MYAWQRREIYLCKKKKNTDRDDVFRSEDSARARWGVPVWAMVLRRWRTGDVRHGGAEQQKGCARGTATAPGAWTPDGSIGSPLPLPPPLLYRAALSRQKPCRPPVAARRIAVAAHARPRIELYGTSSRRRYRRRHHGRRPETPTERSSAAAAVSRGTRVIVIALTHPTDFSVFILRPPDGFFFFLFFLPPSSYSFC